MKFVIIMSKNNGYTRSLGRAFLLLSLSFCIVETVFAYPEDDLTTPPIEVEMCPAALQILADTLRYNKLYDDSLQIQTKENYGSVYLLPLIFYGKVSPSDFKVAPAKKNKPLIPTNYDYCIDWLKNDIEVDSLRESALSIYMAQHPLAIKYDWYSLPNAPKKEKLVSEVSAEVLKVSSPEIQIKELQIGLPTADKWYTKMNSAIQFSQNYVSDNWYQGGESNINILSIQSLNIKRYDASARTEFETKVDLKTGFYTTPSDTMRAFRVNDNLFQLASKYGVKAFKRWYYTGSLLFKTQVFNSYKANTNDLLTQFLSPAELNLSLGMDYKYFNTKKTFTWSVLMAPLAYNLKYVKNITDIDETRFGLTQGKHTLNQVGSSLTNQIEWKMTQNIKWASRLFLFSNYSTSQGDFENVFDFSINRFFSTRISLHLRYDDDVKPEDDVFQFKELLSFGFNYYW